MTYFLKTQTLPHLLPARSASVISIPALVRNCGKAIARISVHLASFSKIFHVVSVFGVNFSEIVANGVAFVPRGFHDDQVSLQYILFLFRSKIAIAQARGVSDIQLICMLLRKAEYS